MSDIDLDAVVAFIVLNRDKGVDRLQEALAIGKLLLDQVFQGDVEAFRSKGRATQSLRALANHEQIADVGVSRRTLGDYVGVYVQQMQLPPEASGLGLSQRIKMLSLSGEELAEVAVQSAKEGWSARQVQAEVRRRRSSTSSVPESATVAAPAPVLSLEQSLSALMSVEPSEVAILQPEEAHKAGELVRRLQARLDLFHDDGSEVCEPEQHPESSTSSSPTREVLVVRRGDGPLTEVYKPLRFAEVLGNEKAVALLQRYARERSRRPFLLYGPSGTGKTTLARIYAMSVLCEGDRSGGVEPCGECDECRGCLTDTINPWGGGIGVVAAAASGDPKDAAAAVIDQLRSPYDAVIVNEADRLLIQQQRLLHILERHLHCPVLFCTVNLNKFDDQFTGRCIPVETAAPSKAEVTAYLRQVAHCENVALHGGDIDRFVEALDGSTAGQMRDLLMRFEGWLLQRREQQAEIP